MPTIKQLAISPYTCLAPGDSYRNLAEDCGCASGEAGWGATGVVNWRVLPFFSWGYRARFFEDYKNDSNGLFLRALFLRFKSCYTFESCRCMAAWSSLSSICQVQTIEKIVEIPLVKTSTCETHCAVLGEFELNPNDFDGMESLGIMEVSNQIGSCRFFSRFKLLRRW